MPLLLAILLLSTPLTIQIQDAATGIPVAGVILAGMQADGTPWQATSDAAGQIRLEGTGVWVQITQATDPTGQALVFSANTPDGALRLPLDGTPLGLRLLIEPGRLFVEPIALADPTVQALADANAPAVNPPTPVPTPTVPPLADPTVPTPMLADDESSPDGAGWAWLGWLLLLVLLMLGVWRWAAMRPSRRHP